jgi:hypothetical protein
LFSFKTSFAVTPSPYTSRMSSLSGLMTTPLSSSPANSPLLRGMCQ